MISSLDCHTCNIMLIVLLSTKSGLYLNYCTVASRAAGPRASKIIQIQIEGTQFTPHYHSYTIVKQILCGKGTMSACCPCSSACLHLELAMLDYCLVIRSQPERSRLQARSSLLARSSLPGTKKEVEKLL